VRTVLYLHGFASSPQGRKIALLREKLPANEFRLVAPDLNRPSFEKLSFEAIVQEAVRVAQRDPPDIVIGSSLGALVALEASRRGVTAPLVLIAPALAFGKRWTEKLAPGDPVRFFHHGQGKDLQIHRRFLEEMTGVTVDRDPPKQKVIVVMGEQDESVPFEGVEATWTRWEASGSLAEGSRFVPIAGGDHGLIGFVDQISAATRSL
jgi:predicted esterase YcpF (UPF0227 family)